MGLAGLASVLIFENNLMSLTARKMPLANFADSPAFGKLSPYFVK
jgi:hypothetical protein